jgi:hypothetical protein
MGMPHTKPLMAPFTFVTVSMKDCITVSSSYIGAVKRKSPILQKKCMNGSTCTFAYSHKCDTNTPFPVPQTEGIAFFGGKAAA